MHSFYIISNAVKDPFVNHGHGVTKDATGNSNQGALKEIIKVVFYMLQVVNPMLSERNPFRFLGGNRGVGTMGGGTLGGQWGGVEDNRERNKGIRVEDCNHTHSFYVTSNPLGF